MSRAYDMYLQVTGFQADRLEAIKAAAQEVWEFDWFCDAPALLDGFGESQLCGGETEEQFAERLARAIWAANGGPCEVIVNATYLEDLPYESYTFGQEEFERLQSETPIPKDNP